MPRAKTPRNGDSRKRSVPTLTAPPAEQNHSVPTEVEEEIRRRAYELYQQRGCTPGREHEDWLMAEREVADRSQQHSV
jgi:hypothetical protein